MPPVRSGGARGRLALLDGNNEVLIGTAAQLPAPLTLPAIDGPTLMLADNSAALDRKLLVVTGRTTAELERAGDALVLGEAAMSDSGAPIPRRYRCAAQALRCASMVADRAPRLVQGNRRRSEAVTGLRQLLRCHPRQFARAADLHSCSGQGVPLDLKYRYTARTVQNDSALAVSINDQLVRSFRLPLRAEHALH